MHNLKGKRETHVAGDTTRLQQHTKDLIAWMATRPPWEDDRGKAGIRLYEDAVAAGFTTAARSRTFAATLARLEERGVIERTVRGKRTFRIALVDPPALPEPPPEPPPEPDYIREHVPAKLPSDLGIDGPAVVDAEEVAPPPPLVATVRLELEVDPAMARMVLDLVERGAGVRPVDRDEVGRMIERNANAATKRNAEGMSKAMDRIAALEIDVASIGGALRSLGGHVSPIARDVDTARITKPDFHRLGVKDSQQRKLLTDLAIDGWTFERANGSGHIKASKDGHKTLQLSCTPSDHRTPLNERSRARQAGAMV